MSYRENKARARTVNNQPSATDQQAVQDTDRMVIINQLLKTGTAPGAPTPPMFGDFTGLPTDLRGFIETARRMPDLRHALPAPFKDMPTEELMTLTNEQFNDKILALLPKEQPKEPT